MKSLVVLTDGVENSPRFIADVAGDINEFTYAVGLGQPQNISVPALQSISGNNGGYLLVTGAIGTDNRFLLQKYFLQILARYQQRRDRARPRRPTDLRASGAGAVPVDCR